MRSNRRMIFVFGLIIVFVLVVRLIGLAENSPPLYFDEVAGAYRRMYSPSWWDGVIYLTGWLGLTPLAVRLPSAVLGSLIPVAVWWMVNGLNMGDKRDRGNWVDIRLTALLSALLASAMPWSFMISRIGHTDIPLVVLLVCLSAGFYLRGRFWWSLLFLGLGAFVYPSVIVIAPFVVGMMGWEWWREADRKSRIRVVGGIGVIGVILIVTFLVRYQGYSVGSRGFDLAIWRDVNVTAETNLYRGIAQEAGGESEAKYFYNFPVAVGQQFLENYLSFFSPEWLFLKGDPVLRHSTGMVGEFYLWLLPFMVAGAYALARSRPSTSSGHAKNIFFAWILASPIPAAITNDGGGYLLRAVTMMPFLTVLCAIGIVDVWYKVSRLRQGYGGQVSIKYKVFRIGYVIGLFLVGGYSAAYFLFGYFHVYPVLAARSYEYGFKEVSDFQVAHDNTSMLVIWQGYYPSWYFRFWQRTPVEEFRKPPWDSEQIGESVFNQAFSNLYFTWPAGADDLEGFLAEGKVDYVVFPGGYVEKYPEYASESLSLVEEIKYPDKSTAFEVYGVTADN